MVVNSGANTASAAAATAAAIAFNGASVLDAAATGSGGGSGAVNANALSALGRAEALVLSLEQFLGSNRLEDFFAFTMPSGLLLSAGEAALAEAQVRPMVGCR